ncbi:hypothetical protein ACFOY8_12675 [Thalassospira xianhensis]|uniref:Uncharacterized protein n=1 Tax=Thalassospira xianhensis MCCC 1A02616 TaxID=1177929 RepID=A0A367UG53_9PROT|nr:hypothetical protein [Thalassospira xianhensis]RCK06294.1 hypothetical protein TH5_08760 [Thalassospira xianhensis MCCC 1A02616]
MNGDIRQEALKILDELKPVIELNFYANGGWNPDELKSVRTTLSKLASDLLEPTPLNPGYRNSRNLLSELLYCGWNDSEAYAKIFENLPQGKRWHHDAYNIRTERGLWHLYSVYHSLGDDHSYGMTIDTASGLPQLMYTDSILTDIDEIYFPLMEYRLGNVPVPRNP